MKTDFRSVELWGTKFTWPDVEGCLGENEKKLYDKLPENLQELMYKKNGHTIGKGLEYGLMTDWENVMKTSISDCNLFEVIIGQRVRVPHQAGHMVEAIVTGHDIEDGLIYVESDDGFETATYTIDDVEFIPGGIEQGNDLLEYDAKELIIAGIRKMSILHLASKGGFIDNEAIIDIANRITEELNTTVELALSELK